MQVGGYFSIKRNIMSIPSELSVTQEQLIPFTEALLRVFRCASYFSGRGILGAWDRKHGAFKDAWSTPGMVPCDVGSNRGILPYRSSPNRV